MVVELRHALDAIAAIRGCQAFGQGLRLGRDDGACPADDERHQVARSMSLHGPHDRGMKRDEWKFEYTAARLAEAADAKISHHSERLAFWKGKRDEVLATIRADGLEIDEKIVVGYQSPKSRDWDRANRVSVRDDLRQKLDEVLEKLRDHTEQLTQYEGWSQMLCANPEQRVGLDIDDWLFFLRRA